MKYSFILVILFCSQFSIMSDHSVRNGNPETPSERSQYLVKVQTSVGDMIDEDAYFYYVESDKKNMRQFFSADYASLFNVLDTLMEKLHPKCIYSHGPMFWKRSCEEGHISFSSPSRGEDSLKDENRLAQMQDKNRYITRHILPKSPSIKTSVYLGIAQLESTPFCFLYSRAKCFGSNSDTILVLNNDLKTSLYH